MSMRRFKIKYNLPESIDRDTIPPGAWMQMGILDKEDGEPIAWISMEVDALRSGYRKDRWVESFGFTLSNYFNSAWEARRKGEL
jgi:hypothetical protein